MKVFLTDMSTSTDLQTTRALTFKTAKRVTYITLNWDFAYPKKWAFGLTVKTYVGDRQRWVTIGWGWAEGEIMSPFPRYQWMPNREEGKTATWCGFFCQHSPPFEFVSLNP